MPISKDPVTGAITYTPPSRGDVFEQTGVASNGNFAVCDKVDQLKQIKLDPSAQTTNTTTTIKSGAVSADTTVTLPAVTGTISAAAFKTVQTPAGTSPTAVTPTDTLTLTSSDNSVTITGTAGTDTIDFKAAAGAGTVTGPGSSVATQIPTFSDTTGKVLQASTMTVGAGGNFTATNATISGTPGTGSQVNTGDPNTKGLIVKGNTYTPPQAQPNTITGLQVWLKADALSLTDGTAVGTWTDSSGNGYDATQATAGQKPIFKTSILNSKPVVRFAHASSQYLTNTTLPSLGASDYTFFIVASPTTESVLQVALNIGNNSAQTEAQMYLTTSGLWHFAAVSGSDFGTTAPTIASTSWHILSATKGGNTGSFTPFIDGAATTAASGAVTTNPAAGYYVAGTAVGTATWDGDFAEVIIYNRSLTSNERGQVEAYLSSKYNITISNSVAQVSNLQEWQSFAGTTLSAVDSSGNITTQNIGAGLKIKEGTNARMGTSTLSAGAVTVSNTSVTASSRIFLTHNTLGGTVGTPYVSARVAGTSFTITSTSNTDTSTIAWMIVEPA